MSSILDDVKHQLGITAEETAFDSGITIFINAAFGDLTQLGLGPVVGFQITDKSNEWTEFTADPRLSAVKTYIFLKTKLVFDPPGTGFVLNAYERQIEELQFRLNVVADYG